MSDLYIILLALLGLAGGAVLIYFTLKYFEIAVFLVAFSSWIPHIFLQNSPHSLLEEDAGLGSYIRVSLMLLMGLCGVIKFLQYLPEHKFKIPVQFQLLGLFILLAFVSITYSLDPYISFVRTTSFLAFMGFLLGLYAWIKEEEQFYRILNALYFVTLLFLALSFLGLIFMPGRVWWWNISSRFIGIWGHPNTTGIFCLTAYPILIWKIYQTEGWRRIFNSGLILFVLAMQVMTGSRTALFASAIGICIWFLLQKKGVKTAVILGAIGFGLFVLIQARPESLERSESRDITAVTGRDEFWRGAILLISEKPLSGYGYSVEGKIWEDPRFYKEGYALWSGSSRVSLHNGYLSIAVGVGVVGLAIWISLLLIPLFKTIGKNVSLYKSFAVAVIVMNILVNFTESSFDSPSSFSTVFFWIAWVMAAKLDAIEETEPISEVDQDELLEENYAA